MLNLSYDELLRYSADERTKWRQFFAKHPEALDVAVQPGGRLPTVGKLIDHQHNKWKKLVSFLGIQPALNKFLIVFPDIPCACFFQQIIAVIHFNTKRIQRMNNLFCICNNRILFTRKFCQEMFFNMTIQTQFDFFRIN